MYTLYFEKPTLNMETGVGMKLFAVLSLFVAIQAQDPTVTVAEGNLVGKTVQFIESQFINVSKNVDVFLGVPYADPPRRFKPPTAKQEWDGSLNVKEFKPACKQEQHFLPRGEPVDEDCLYLNIYAPSPKPTNAAVMVWIHGGGFISGTAMTYSYYGVPLVAVGDVIVVAINYRLGAFGKFTTKDDEAPGNVGMLDQVAAIQWIHDNIGAFGGDNSRITLFGESAGAVSVEFHTLSKLSEGLFNQIITQSGTTLPFFAFDVRTNEEEVKNAYDFGATLGCTGSNSSDLLACLEGKTSDEILYAGATFYAYSAISVDGYFLEDTPTNLYKKGDFKRCPMMTGVNKDEGTLYLPPLPPSGYNDLGRPLLPHLDQPTVREYIRAGLLISGLEDDIFIDAILQEYMDWSVADDPSANVVSTFLEYSGDSDFVCPTDFVSRIHAREGDQVFKYFMTHIPSRSTFDGFQGIHWYAAGHAEDLAFVFGHPFINQLEDIGQTHLLTDQEKELSVKVMTFWTNFAKSGDPSKSSQDTDPGEGESYWPQFTVPELYHKVISLDLEVERALKARECHFWNVFFPELQEFVESLPATGDDALIKWQNSFQEWKGILNDWETSYEKYKKSPTCP
ncbi:cholinesterase 1-like [Lytechinus pictus]|uniref:cholinesterase 1-like n=1 Tax=Lytechinus pictus TaxID=7653 RepID=UPI0030B9FD08